MKKLNFIVFCLLVLNVLPVLAGNSKGELSSVSTVEVGKDTVPFRISPDFLKNNDIESFDDIDNSDNDFVDESAAYDPNFDYYGIWDTISVNPYKMDLTQKPDTTLIILQDRYQCDYNHPYCGNITSDFGPRSRVRYHYGVDIKLETGEAVRCSFEGTVRIARRSSTFGNVVMVRHKNGLETIYAHLSAIHVKIGQHVESGEILGLGGNTGHSSGSHLHYEVRYKGMPINPNSIISIGEGRLVRDSIAIDKSNFSYIVDFRTKSKSYTKSGKHGKYYVVKKGDTLGKIAQRKNVSLKKLCRLNGIRTTTVLRPGKRLRLV
ncbi:MAG: peptidoglycan DD-metalloendopeptidase family protein [Bacteroidetes bacterium]|nr:peptidoglycan DD-metalloendopeptidase family protein [Bacteroidota bacterium]